MDCPICRKVIRTLDNSISHRPEFIAYCASVLIHNMTQTKHLYFEGTGSTEPEAVDDFVKKARAKKILGN